MAILLDKFKNYPLSLYVECSHIVRDVLVWARTLEGYKHSLAHPTKGLNMKYIFDLARDNGKSVALTIVVQNLPAMRWAMCLEIVIMSDSYSIIHLNIMAVLVYDPSKHVEVVDKITGFIGRIAHKGLAKMMRMQFPFELANMCFGANILEQR